MNSRKLEIEIVIALLIACVIAMFIWKPWKPSVDSKSKTTVTTTTEVVPGDTSFTKASGSDPVLISVENPVQLDIPTPKPIIIYREKEGMAREIDTMTIIKRYNQIISVKDSLISVLRKINHYTDTVHSDSSEVTVVINDRVQFNKLLPGRSVYIMNLRPKIVNTTTVHTETENIYNRHQFYVGGNAGSIGTDYLAGLNFDWKTKRRYLIGGSLSWNLHGSEKLYLIRCSVKL